MKDETRDKIKEYLADTNPDWWPPFTPCKYAEETDEPAFPTRPCKGNKVICRHPETNGMISCQRECSFSWCRRFEDKEEACRA